MDVTTKMQLIKGCRVLDRETEEVFVVGGLSPKPVGAPPPKAGLLAFKMVGGVPKLLSKESNKNVIRWGN